MFRDESQKATVCCVLLGQVDLGRLFTDDGPTEEIEKLWSEGGGDLTGDERLIVLTASAVWTGDGGPTVSELRALSPANLVAVGSMMRCISDSPEMIDSWLRGSPVQD